MVWKCPAWSGVPCKKPNARSLRMHFLALKIIINFKVHIEFLDAGDVIKIEGPPTDADKSREILEEQAKELMTKMDFTEINVDAKYHKHIIGKGGSTVNKLKQETEVMINIPDSDKAPSNVIRIEGNKDGVKKAKEVSIV